HIPTRVVQFVLDDDQISLLIQRQQVQPLAGLIETVELLLDDQEVFPQHIWLVGNPFLKMVPLPESKIGEPNRLEPRDPVTSAVDAIHESPAVRLVPISGSSRGPSAEDCISIALLAYRSAA